MYIIILLVLVGLYYFNSIDLYVSLNGRSFSFYKKDKTFKKMKKY